jgi:ligand-binding sensor domain-containing protein/signal transduction histidine kinase
VTILSVTIPTALPTHVRRLGLLMSLAVVLLAAPLLAAEPDTMLHRYALTSWSEADGRPLGSVYALAQDRDGYLWIGADAGLVRFDGSRFSAWDAISDAALPQAPVLSLHVSRDGTLWVGFGDGAGIRRIRGGQVLPPEGGETLTTVRYLAEDPGGTIWAMSDFQLFARRNDAWQRVTLPSTGRANRVHQPFVDSAGDLWIATRWGMFRQRRGTSTFESLSDDYTWGVTEDASRAIWTTDIITGFRKLGSTAPPRHQLEGAGYRVLHDRRDNIWVATFGHGLWQARPDGTVIGRASLRSGLSNDTVLSLFEDRDGNIWVGTTSGFHRFTERTLTPVDDVGFVLAIAPAGADAMWAGTSNGVVRATTRDGAWLPQPVGTLKPDIRTFYREDDGTLWIGASDGLWRLNGTDLRRIALPHPEPLIILSISPAAGGGLWLGDANWLYHWHEGRLTPLKPTNPDAPPITRILFGRTDRQGRVWLGLDGGRLAVAEIDGTVRTITSAAGLPEDGRREVHALFEDAGSVILLGTNSGLIRVRDNRVSVIGSANGLPGNRVWSIAADGQGHVWLSMDRGLVRVDRDELHRAMDTADHRLRYRLYDPHDGVAGSPAGVVASTRGADGTLWFVRGGGLTRFDPRRALPDPPPTPLPVRIEAAIADERRLPPSDGTALQGAVQRLQISYTALTLTTRSNKLRFRYRLDGFDTNWVDAGSRRTAFYTNLPPRDYRFQVEAATEDGTWDTSTAMWAFTVRPKFYQTRPFYAVIGLVALVCIAGAWRFRLRIVQREFSLVLAERTRLARELHDTLLQSMVGVALKIEHVATIVTHSPTVAREHLLGLRRDVQGYMREARQSIFDLRSPVFDTADLATALRSFGERVVASTPVRFVCTVTGTPAHHGTALENQLLRIGQEAISNAVRHAQATEIRLELGFDDDAVLLRVSDNGRGFDGRDMNAVAAGHYGLSSMRERAAQLGGSVRIATSPGGGTAVEAIIPTTAAPAATGAIA